MFFSNEWNDFKLLDCGNCKKIEKWGKYILVRPENQAVWPISNKNLWNKIDAEYIISDNTKWHIYNKNMPFNWTIEYKNNIKFQLQLLPSSKHTGIFPEQISNWNLIDNIIKKESCNRKINILNLFGYTGASTIIASSAGKNNVSICHVDASKKMISIAKKNSILSYTNKNNIRWIVDDCIKFIHREIKRKNKYDIIILDPPSYGKGPKNEIWKIEKKIFELINNIVQLLSNNPLLILVNTYSTYISADSIAYMLKLNIKNKCKVTNDSLGLLVENSQLYLPCGYTTRFIF